MKPSGASPGSVWWLVSTPAARSYLVIGLATLMIHFLVMSSRAGEIGALLMLAVAAPGLVTGWVVSPALFILLSTYLFIDPYFEGLDSGYRSRSPGRGANTPLFNIEDLLLASSALGYLISHYRLQSLAMRGMPAEPRIHRKGEREGEIVRPASLVNDAEMGVFLALTMSAMILGQFLWWILVVAERRLGVATGSLVQVPVGRLMLFALVTAAITFVATLVFSYLRWIRMNRLEARIILQDEVWAETRREHERILHWTQWHQKQTAVEKQEKLK